MAFMNVHWVEKKPRSVYAIYMLLWWEWFGFIFQSASSTDSQSVRFSVQAAFNLHFGFISYLWVAPGLESPPLPETLALANPVLVPAMEYLILTVWRSCPPGLSFPDRCSKFPSVCLAGKFLGSSEVLVPPTLSLPSDRKTAWLSRELGG